MTVYDWLSDNWIEIFGAVTGIIYVFLEIRQNIWLWPVGIITSAVYILVFFTNKFYADMSLQVYYLVISVLGWYWWVKGTGGRALKNDPVDHFSEGARLQGEVHETLRLPSLEGSGVGLRRPKIKCYTFKMENWHNPGNNICGNLFPDVVCFITVNRLSRTGMGFVYYFTFDSSNLDACPQDI